MIAYSQSELELSGERLKYARTPKTRGIKVSAALSACKAHVDLSRGMNELSRTSKKARKKLSVLADVGLAANMREVEDDSSELACNAHCARA